VRHLTLVFEASAATITPVTQFAGSGEPSSDFPLYLGGVLICCLNIISKNQSRISLESYSAEDLRYVASSFITDPSVTRSCHHFIQVCDCVQTGNLCIWLW
ncbi:hypothetical protein, partial [Bacteroides acidifaciens]|uniref:hypothetical protein n=1 Tax=Bacteroides acidifaciens TaxID=85831 RepID=UPI0025B2D587